MSGFIVVCMLFIVVCVLFIVVCMLFVVVCVLFRCFVRTAQGVNQLVSHQDIRDIIAKEESRKYNLHF